MKKVANSRASQHTTNKQEFKGSNTFAEWNGSNYVVYSYGYHFPMYVWNGSQWFENSDKYSPTTSKQQTQLRPNVSDFELRTTQELKAML